MAKLVFKFGLQGLARLVVRQRVREWRLTTWFNEQVVGSERTKGGHRAERKTEKLTSESRHGAA